MIDILSLPADQIGADHIHALITSAVPESELIEFKEALSAKGQNADPWMLDQRRLGDRAKDKLLSEGVAFANAYGGALLLGIRESNTRPPVAIGIEPIPQCAALAERLTLVFRDRVEPPLPSIEIFAVPTRGDDGVVIIRAARSRLGPHRITKTRVCPVRRADRCEEMSMRDIQDMTLNMSKGLQRLELALRKRSQRFPDEFDRLSVSEDAFGIRLTAMPVGDDIRVPKVFQNGDISRELSRPPVTVSRCDEAGDQRQLEGLQQVFGFNPLAWRPLLRGARAEDPQRSTGSPLHSFCYMELHASGLIEVGILSVRMFGPALGFEAKPIPIPAESPVVDFSHLAIWADQLRNASSSPASEYAIDIEIRVTGDDVGVAHSQYYRLGALKKGDLRFPTYSFGDIEGLPGLAALFEADFWNSLGRDIGAAQGSLVIQKTT